MRVAVLEHEPKALELLHDMLANYILPGGERTISVFFHNSAQMLRRLRQEDYDLIFLGFEAPVTHSLDVLLWIIDNLKPAPCVILLASRTAELDIVSAFDAGADDYIFKPFNKAELIARVKKVMRQGEHRREVEVSGEFASFGNISFDIIQSKVYVAGTPVLLTLREFNLALLLFSNRGRVLSREYLYERFWKRDEVLSSRTLDTHIYRIRTKLGLNAEHGFYLKTIYGFGYCLDFFSSESLCVK